jgi:hypothetical protein
VTEKIWITRAYSYYTGEKETVVAIWWKQKPALEVRDNERFWWGDCRGKCQDVSKELSKVLFGMVPKEHEIYTAEKTDEGFKITKRETMRDCPVKNVGIRFSMEW